MTSAALNPIDHPRAWDVIKLGGVESPGLAELGDEWERETEWDRKKGKGAAGETQTLTNLPACDGTVTFTLWTAAHFKEWEKFRPLFMYDPIKKTSPPLDIYHPALADLKIKSVVCQGISAIKKLPRKKYQIVVKLLEYKPPPPASAVYAPTGSKSNANTSGAAKTGTPPDPIADAQQAEIARLLAEAKKP